jgi:DNA-nicking Smr family endonuclease
MRRLKILSEHDRAAWAQYARAVRPLAGRIHPEPPAVPSSPPVPQPQAAPNLSTPARYRPAPPSLVTGAHPAGLDKSTWNRFSGGKLTPERTLDLHGKTAQAAYHALGRFLYAAHNDHLRCVEIITGRGTGENGGVIRRELPQWLNLPELRPLILATAHPHATNPGAVRILLRRPR